MRIPSRNVTPPARVSRSTRFQCSSTCRSFSGSTSTHRPLMSVSPSLLASSCRFSPSVSGAPSMVSSTEKSSSEETPSPAAGFDPTEITGEDLDDDPMEAVSQLLQRDEGLTPQELEAQVRKGFRFDLCPTCHGKFVKDPLGREYHRSFDFSEN